MDLNYIQISRTSLIDIVVPSKISGGHFVKNFKKVPYRSEMARNVIESEFRTSKMATGGHFVKLFFLSSVSIWNGQKCDRNWISIAFLAILSNISTKTNFRIYLKWPEMRSKVIFGHPKWLPVAILWKKSQKFKLWYRSEMVRKNIYKKSDLNNVRTDCWPNTTLYKFTFGQYIYRQVCWERGNIHCVHPLGRMHTILVKYICAV